MARDISATGRRCARLTLRLVATESFATATTLAAATAASASTPVITVIVTVRTPALFVTRRLTLCLSIQRKSDAICTAGFGSEALLRSLNGAAFLLRWAFMPIASRMRMVAIRAISTVWTIIATTSAMAATATTTIAPAAIATPAVTVAMIAPAAFGIPGYFGTSAAVIVHHVFFGHCTVVRVIGIRQGGQIRHVDGLHRRQTLFNTPAVFARGLTQAFNFKLRLDQLIIGMNKNTLRMAAFNLRDHRAFVVQDINRHLGRDAHFDFAGAGFDRFFFDGAQNHDGGRFDRTHQSAAFTMRAGFEVAFDQTGVQTLA